jgi:hypothetical protein
MNRNQKIPCTPQLSISQLARNGPPMSATPNPVTVIPRPIGTQRRGRTLRTYAYRMADSAAPMPSSTRPTRNSPYDGAVALISEPIAKMAARPMAVFRAP